MHTDYLPTMQKLKGILNPYVITNLASSGSQVCIHMVVARCATPD